MRIAFYLNPQDTGHCRRFEAIAQQLPPDCEVAVIGMGTQPPVADIGHVIERVDVPRLDETAKQFFASQLSQGTPKRLMGDKKSAAFYQSMMSFLNTWEPDALVIDTGLEAAALAEVYDIPTIYIREHGQRWDTAHERAYDHALSLLAYFPDEMEQPDCPEWIKEKTTYSGGFSRFSKQEKSAHKPISYADDKPNILVMTEFLSVDATVEKFSQAASALSGWQWNFVGARAKLQSPQALSDNICYHGRLRDFWPYLSHADLVVSNAGQSLIMEIATAGAPALFIPDERPYAAQVCRAAALEKMGLGVVATEWPGSSDWANVYQRSHEPARMDWQRLITPNAAQKAAVHIAQTVKSHLDSSPHKPINMQPLSAA